MGLTFTKSLPGSGDRGAEWDYLLWVVKHRVDERGLDHGRSDSENVLLLFISQVVGSAGGPLFLAWANASPRVTAFAVLKTEVCELGFLEDAH
jgi:hypothetical protein